MPELRANGITIHYDERGALDAVPLLLIMGLGAQMTLWPDEFVEALALRGFRVIRFDNRDVGLSQKFDGVKAPGMLSLTLLPKLGFRPKAPYSLADMAADAAGVLDGLGIARAHIVGGSMGGMIAQHFAARYPERTLSLTSMFSSTGNPQLPPARKEALKALLKRPKGGQEDALVSHGMMVARTIGSPGFPPEEGRLRERVRANVRRSFYPEGATRHLAAVVCDGDRRAMLAGIEVPTLVLHGDDDPLVPVEGGHDTAASIRSARLRTFAGWGHDLPPELTEKLADAIADHAHSSVEGR